MSRLLPPARRDYQTPADTLQPDSDSSRRFSFCASSSHTTLIVHAVEFIPFAPPPPTELRSSREVVESPSLEIFKTRLDKVLYSLL